MLKDKIEKQKLIQLKEWESNVIKLTNNPLFLFFCKGNTFLNVEETERGGKEKTSSELHHDREAAQVSPSWRGRQDTSNAVLKYGV